MTYRIAVYGTGNVGKQALRGVIAHPDLQLCAVLVSAAEKIGRDAADLADLTAPTGVTATADVDAVLAAEPDCVVYAAATDDRLEAALADQVNLLRHGVNVVASGPVFLQFPYGVVPDELFAPIAEAADAGRASILVNGIDPGFANDLLPLALTGTCARVDQVRCMEIVNYATYDSATVLFDVMGFGKPLDDVPLLLQPGVLSMAWGSVVRQIANALGLRLDHVEEVHERDVATADISTSCGIVPAGTAAALHFEVRGIADGKIRIVLEHFTRLHDDLRPDWPQPAGAGGSYRIEVEGEPRYALDLVPHSHLGDHNHAALVGTAMRLVNAAPAVITAAPGLLTARDLPLIPGWAR